MAVENGYTQVHWMRTGTKGWMDAFLAIETDSDLLQNVMLTNRENPASWVIGSEDVASLRNPTLVDFRPAEDYEKGHADGAINIPYEEMWTFANLEKLNKSKEIVIIHDDPILAGALAVSLALLEYETYILQ